MSELINTHDNHATIRWKLLTGASALALTAYVSSADMAKADDTDRPTIWIELGGQMEQMSGLSSPFTAPFLSVTPTPDLYKGFSVGGFQRPPRFALGEEGKITFQPADSDWLFFASIRYGRSHSRSHVHEQLASPSAPFCYTSSCAPTLNPLYYAPFFDHAAASRERHMVLDFSAGKDVGVGLLGQNGSSSVSAGVRLVDLTESSTVSIFARPNVNTVYRPFKYLFPQATFHQYTMTAHTARSFRGVGPSLSWNASADLAGNEQDGELMLDWGINGAVIFGRQKAKVQHNTRAYKEVHYYSQFVTGGYLTKMYPPRTNHSTRSRRVTVPNLGGSVGLSVKYPNVKFSVGYRADIFFGAMDRGIDVRKDSDLTFNGPYASVSIGLGD